MLRTTRPFELCGAPWLDGAALAARLRELRVDLVVQSKPQRLRQSQLV